MSTYKVNKKLVIPAAILIFAAGIRAFVALNSIPGVPLLAALAVVVSTGFFIWGFTHLTLQALTTFSYKRAKIAGAMVMIMIAAEFAAQWLFSFTGNHGNVMEELVTSVAFSFMTLGGSILIAIETWRAWEVPARASGFAVHDPVAPPSWIEADVLPFYTRLAQRHPKWTKKLLTETAYQEFDAAGGKRPKINTEWVDELPPDYKPPKAIEPSVIPDPSLNGSRVRT